MKTRLARLSWVLIWAVAAGMPRAAHALDPRKALTQYSRHTWDQHDGLPQDTIRCIAQTSDGYLWLGTDEGLARFDGYEFTVYTKSKGDLPDNSINALAASPDGSLWIGTASGLVQYHGGRFRTYSAKDGLPDENITGLYAGRSGTLWVIAGLTLGHMESGKFVSYTPTANLLATSVRVVREDAQGRLLVAGFGGVVRLKAEGPETLVDASMLGGSVVTSMLVDRHGNLWVGDSLGLIQRSPAGRLRRFSPKDGLPDQFVRSLVEDHDGNIWIGTNGGMARLEGEDFKVSWRDIDLVRSLFEDREGNLWVGANNGLTRFRDDVFTVYGKPEGLPSNEPNAAFQDHLGRVWVGFHDSGLMFFSGSARPTFTMVPAMPETEIFSIREAHDGDLLIGTRMGAVRMHGSQFSVYEPPDPWARHVVFDAMEDRSGNLWLATTAGLVEKRGQTVRTVIAGGPLFVNAVVTLCEGRDGTLWAGSIGKGLWRVQGEDVRSFTTSEGLSSDNIRELYEDSDGTLWIGTFGGGLDALRDGKFRQFRQKDGLLSDNVANIADDGESLWLSTTRGICRVPKRQLWDLSAGKRSTLEPTNYGVADGLRSAQCTPGYPTGGWMTVRAYDRLWFTTGRGLAVFDRKALQREALPPAVHIVEIAADGRPVDLTRPARLAPGVERVRFRYVGVHLSAPEQVQYFYKLSGLETNWVAAGSRRETNFNSLAHGNYTFTVKAQLPDGESAQQSYSFEELPQYYETVWFRIACGVLLAASAWALYQLRLRSVRNRFSLVLEERTRLAREIHDTLAQGFVGISSQLDAVAMCMPDQPSPARQYLDMARRMARHSLTEARRSVMDLRASVLEGQDLAKALEAGTRLWTAGSNVKVDVEVSGPGMVLPEEMEQHLLRIAQEAVTNTLKHAGARRISIQLHTGARKVYMRIKDDGRGFEQEDVFDLQGGHFGLIGMRERAERLGGEMRLASHPGEGTEVEVTVPLS